MPLAAMSTVVDLAVEPVQIPHRSGDVRLPRRQDEMVVRPEQHEEVQLQPIPLHGQTEERDEALTVDVVSEERLAARCLRKDVVDRAGGLNAVWTRRHAPNLRQLSRPRQCPYAIGTLSSQPS